MERFLLKGRNYRLPIFRSFLLPAFLRNSGGLPPAVTLRKTPASGGGAGRLLVALVRHLCFSPRGVSKATAFGGSCLLFFFIALWWFFCGTVLNVRAKSAPLVQAVPLLEYVPVEPYKELISYVIKPGDTFLRVLSQYGVSSDIVIGCHRFLVKLGLPSLLPGDSLVVSRDKKGSLLGFSLLHKLNWYRVTLEDARIKADIKPVDVSLHQCLVRGVLSTSLSEDMNAMGVDDACVAKFADIFAWDINFFVDPQAGDSFEILFDKKFNEGRFAGYGDIIEAKYVNRGRLFEAIGIKDKGIIRYYDADGKSLQKQFLKAPLRFSHISSGFSMHRRHPILGIVRPHLGIDYAAPSGTPVYAAADGVVCFAGFNGGFGNFVSIRHGASYETSYGHLRSFARGTRCGARVSQGDLIGTVGQTGLATGPHLDYRMTVGKRLVNPSTISLPREKSIPAENKERFEQLKRECGAVFNLRLKGKTGCFVLGVEEVNSAASVFIR